MYSSAIIIFREVLEISLIVGVILAATRGLPDRSKWVWLGIVGGIAGSALVALFAGAISAWAEGMGQELFNAGILLLAAFMIGWTVVWMRRHARELSAHIKEVGRQVSDGERPLYALSIVILLAMLREGSEIVLFTYGQYAAGETLSAIAMGSALGLAVGAAVGVALYLGLLKIPTRYLFSVTSWLLIFLAAGMAGQGASLLSQAGLLPELSPVMWDSSALLSEQSMVGEVLHVLIGYSAQPSGIQLVTYLATIAIIVLLIKTQNQVVPSKPTAKST